MLYLVWKTAIDSFFNNLSREKGSPFMLYLYTMWHIVSKKSLI